MQPAVKQEPADIEPNGTESAYVPPKEHLWEQVQKILERDGQTSSSGPLKAFRGVLGFLAFCIQAFFGAARWCSVCNGQLELVGREQALGSNRFLYGTNVWYCGAAKAPKGHTTSTV